jgi:sugar/nucleoside kinase (ribokinase family)
MKTILVVGETNVDVVLRGAMPQAGREVLADDCVLTLGSASAICAMGLARLGNPVVFVSRAGADLCADYCIDALQRGGVDTSYIACDPALKSGLTVSVASGGDRALVTYLGAIDAVTESDLPDSLLADATHLHVSSYFLQSRLRPGCGRLFARARAHGISTSLDPGFDPREEWDGELRDALQSVDVFLPNERELLAITGCADAAGALRALENGRTRTIVKLGSSGAMTLDDGRVLHVPAFSTTPVDTTGAGDCFNAGFLHAFVRRQPLLDCLTAGNACGALSTRALGGTAAQPTFDEMMAFVRTALRSGLSMP